MVLMYKLLSNHFLVCVWVCLILPFTARAQEVVLQLKWLHQFQFAGYYMAIEKGFYQEFDLNVTALPASAMAPDTIEKVLSGQAHFGVTHSGLLRAYSEGKNVVAMAAMFQSSPYCWMVKADAPISAPKDFSDKTISPVSQQENSELLAMLYQNGVSKERVRLAPKGSGLSEWLSGELDALQVYITNEPFKVKQLGIEYRLVCPKDYGFSVYADILFTTEQFIEQDPKLVHNFYRASLRGWRYALENTEEAIKIIHRKYAPNKTLAELRFEAEQIKRFMIAPEQMLGAMSATRWYKIGELYGIEQSRLDNLSQAFIYRAPARGHSSFSWMYVLSVLLLLIFVPMYFMLLMNHKKGQNKG